MSTYNEVFNEMIDKLEKPAPEESDCERLEAAKELLLKQTRFKSGYDRTIYREALNDLIRLVQ